MSETRPRRGARVSSDGLAEMTLWAPSFRDIAIEGVSVTSDDLAASIVPAERHPDGEHWTARARARSDIVGYAFQVEGRVVSTGRRFSTSVSDPYAREVRRDFFSIARREGSMPRPSAFVRPALRDLVVYELHVYNFTAEDPTITSRLRGTYAGVVAKLPYLADLGFNAIELMPVFDYSDPWQVGVRWNYITACHLCAPHRGYSAAEESPLHEFHDLVEACHARGIALIIDSVFNQVSRRFSYARIYDPAFKHRAKPDLTNNPLLGDFGGTDPNPGSAPYRNRDWGGCDLDYAKPAALEFASDVMRVWFDELGVDGMRFDHTLGFYIWKDQSTGAGAVAASAREIGGEGCYRIAEHFSNDENERELLVDSEFNSQWSKGFFYAAEEAITAGTLEHLDYRMSVRRQGFTDEKPPVVFLNSHDDERLVNRGGSPWWRMQPAVISLYMHPGIPLVYMGDEYAEDNRTRYEWGLPREISPLDWDGLDAALPLMRLHRALAFLRRRLPVLRTPEHVSLARFDRERVLVYGRGEPEPTCIVALNFSDDSHSVPIPAPGKDGPWHEFLFGLTFDARDSRMHFVASDGKDYDHILLPSWYGHIYCREKVWTDEEWRGLFARDRL